MTAYINLDGYFQAKIENAVVQMMMNDSGRVKVTDPRTEKFYVTTLNNVVIVGDKDKENKKV